MEEEDVIISPGTVTTTTTNDDVLEIPKGALDENYGNCFVEAKGKGMYKPTSFKAPAPKPSLSKADAAPKNEPEPQPTGGFAAFMKQIRDGILTGQKDRTKERCAKTMKVFKDLPRDSASFVPAEDVVPVNDFRCTCIIDCNVNGTKYPYLASGWLTVTQTAILYNGSIVLSPARPSSVPEPAEYDVAFAIDMSTLVSVVAAQCPDGDDAEVLAGTRLPTIVESSSVDSASAVILFDNSNHAHQFYDFVWGFTNYAPDAVRNIISQCNFPDSVEPDRKDDAQKQDEVVVVPAEPEQKDEVVPKEDVAPAEPERKEEDNAKEEEEVAKSEQ